MQAWISTVLQSGLLPQRLHSFASRRVLAHACIVLTHGFQRTTDRRQRKAAAGDVPHIRRNEPARPHHPGHFSDRFGRLGHEGDDQRHRGSIKAFVGKRQRLRISLAEVRKLRAGPRARKGKLSLRGIDSIYRARRAVRD